jgi:hypothetical protein
LTEGQWAQYIIDVVIFFNTDHYLGEMLEFDSKQFFNVMLRLFKGKPWKYFSSMHKHFEAQDAITPESLLTKFKQMG